MKKVVKIIGIMWLLTSIAVIVSLPFWILTKLWG